MYFQCKRIRQDANKPCKQYELQQPWNNRKEQGKWYSRHSPKTRTEFKNKFHQLKKETSMIVTFS